jgi:hypothetical protein
VSSRWDGADAPDQWRRDAVALLASEHPEQRDPDPTDRVTVTPAGTLVRAALRPGEHTVLGFSCGYLCAVDEPPGYGFRLVGLLVNGEARVIELPGYTDEDAVVVARTWANYPEAIAEAAGRTQTQPNVDGCRRA